MKENNLSSKVNIEDMEKHLALFGENEPHTFQLFPERKKNLGNKRPIILHGPFSDLKDEIVAYNEAGYAISWLVNQGDQEGRKKENIKKVRALFLDLDGAPFDKVKQAQLKSHSLVKSSLGRCHVYWKVKDCSLENFTLIQQAIAKEFGGDSAVCDLPRVMRLPGSINWKYKKPFTTKLLRCRDTLPHYKVDEIIDGLGLNLDLDLNVKPAPVKSSKKKIGSVKSVFKPTDDNIKAALEHIPSDNRTDWLKVGMAIHKWDNTAVGYEIWSEWSVTSSKFDAITQQQTWNGFKSTGKVTIKTLFYLAKQYGATESFGLKSKILTKKYDHTDLGNSEFLFDRIEGFLRVVKETGQLLVWNGARWIYDNNRLNTEAIDAVKVLAQAAVKCKDETHRIAMQKHAMMSQSKARIDAMAGLVRKNPRLGISQSILNAEPRLLGLNNGVLDLSTGEFRPAAMEDYITQFSSVDYDPEAECPLFLKFVHEIMDGDEEMIAYLQRAVGYTLTGFVKEHCLVFLLGAGRNGKGLLIRIMQKILGDYAISLQPTLLMESRYPGSGPTPELAKLAGKRMICVPEVGDKHVMHEVLVKQLTGADKISARPLYSDVFEFDPQFKIWMMGNSKPVATAEDSAIWQRIHLVEFKRKFVGKYQDKDLESKLLEELPGILRWCAKGCILWQEIGLNLPSTSWEALNKYRAEMDTFGQWLDNCCLVNSGAKLSASLAYTSHLEWCKSVKANPRSNVEFGKLMSRRFKKVRNKSGNFYLGIKLISSDD